MIEKGDLFAYLAEVQCMQLVAGKVTLVIEYGPQECYIRVQLYDPRGERYAFCISKREDQREMERLREVYNKYEKL